MFFCFTFIYFKKLWDELKDLLNAVCDSTDMDMKLKNSLYNWGIKYT